MVLYSYSMALSIVLLAIYALRKLFRGVRILGNTPGLRVPVAPISLIAPLFPCCWINPGLEWHWKWRNQIYQRFGSECLSMVPFLFGPAFLYTSSVEVAQQILANPIFQKSAQFVTPVSQYGSNLFTTNGSEWKRHRRIMGPAFTAETYAMVWDETASVYHEMCAAEGWDTMKVVDIPIVNDITMKVALTVLTRCAYGQHLPWNISEGAIDVHQLAEALIIVSESFLERFILPSWAFKLPIPHFRKVEAAYQVLTRHMNGLIQEYCVGDTVEANRRCDVFSLLLEAREREGKLSMSDSEIMGNTFFVLWAGHETMSHIWDATMGLLALHDDIQEEMYAEIIQVSRETDSSLNFAQASKLNKILCCFLEAGRLYPAGYLLMRQATEATVLTTYDADGPNGSIALEAGANVCIDMIGMHYNPRHFPQPEEYRPSRWFGVSESELSLFSLGPRACIGRKFAMTEACCFLSLLLKDWKLEIVLNEGETRSQWRSRVMQPKVNMTFGVGDMPIRLVKRI
ncbi:cytochrome P450 [Roridomyces roridus]|uniref:Cytochrome P450 n=1 Tax=Roridomyces roridus TaxID=1738132 RepID=A0AAD7BV14_9AGAR|nr:cytochrome P450 [Roridomyces roridus]